MNKKNKAKRYSIIECPSLEEQLTTETVVVIKTKKPSMECCQDQPYFYCKAKILEANGTILKVPCGVKKGHTAKMKVLLNQ